MLPGLFVLLQNHIWRHLDIALFVHGLAFALQPSIMKFAGIALHDLVTRPSNEASISQHQIAGRSVGEKLILCISVRTRRVQHSHSGTETNDGHRD